MMVVQAAGSAPIVEGHPVGNTASWKTIEKTRDESGGVIRQGN
jgi:threonine synthase